METLKKIAEIINFYWKWALLSCYIIFACIVWGNRETHFNRLPVSEASFFHSIPATLAHLFIVLVGVLGLMLLITIAKRPLIESCIIENQFRKIGLNNSIGEYPTLQSKRKDKKKTHGNIYTFKNEGLSTENFKRKLSQLHTAFNGRVYHITHAKNNLRKTLVYVIPIKYDAPSVISYMDDFIMQGMVNLLCVGQTGAGKSYALSVILAGLLRVNHGANTSVTICDYKKADFATAFGDTTNYYGFEDVPDGIRAFYREFQERLDANDEKRNCQKRILLIDEYGTMIAAQDKKQADELKMMVASMLCMGRSLGIIVCVGIQRADAEHFKLGARDQRKPSVRI